MAAPKLLRSTTPKIRNTINFYIKNSIPFLYDVNNQRITVKAKIGNYTSNDGQFPANELNFIKQVRQSIIKQGLHIPLRKRCKKVLDKDGTEYYAFNAGRVHYYYYHPKLKPGDVIEDCYNVDLNLAYWETARMLGLLPMEIYEKGKTITKRTRLACIGSLAKKTKHYEFDPKQPDHKRQRYVGTTHNRETEFLWDIICYEVGKLLYKVAQEMGDDFLFFWVDGIYVRKGGVKKAEKAFRMAGYECKTLDVEKITVTDKRIIVKIPDKSMWKIVHGKTIYIDEKPFPFSPVKNKSYRG